MIGAAPTRAAVIILGPPASGKSTALAALLRPDDTIVHFKVRTHLGRMVDEQDRLAVEHHRALLGREVLPDTVVRHAFADFVARSNSARVMIVEGYPKSAAQLADLDDVLAKHRCRLAGVVVVDAPDTVLRARARQRLTCRACDNSAVAGTDGGCAQCGSDLIRRADDETHRLEARIHHFRTDRSVLDAAGAGAIPITMVDGNVAQPALARRLRSAIDRLAGTSDGVRESTRS